MANKINQQKNDGPTRLISTFTGRSLEDHGSVWSSLWNQDDSDLWDRGKPSPALIDAVEQEQLLKPITSDGRRKRALVPGCGRGYDVVMLAIHGFDVYGLEISKTGVAEAEKYAYMELQKPQGYNVGKEWDTSITPGRVKFIQVDFFKRDWERGIEQKDEESKFDLIYDYTFLCALHPKIRSQWASRMADLLSPGGLLVCLEFPMYKDPALPGPPWGLNGIHWDLLARGGDGIANIGASPEDTDVDKLGGKFRRLLYVKPVRSYEQGNGTDMLSIYERK